MTTIDDPLLNSPYEQPDRYYEIGPHGLTGEVHRGCYVTDDPYKCLTTTLKTDIGPDAWSTLHATVSRPLPRPSSGKVAVKGIDDCGDEVMRVFEV